jgi:hypothetical protein
MGGVIMSEYIGKKMSDHEAMGLFHNGFALMRFDDDSTIENMYGEVLWIGEDEGEAYKQLGLKEDSGRYGVVPGSDYYMNSLGSIF